MNLKSHLRGVAILLLISASGFHRLAAKDADQLTWTPTGNLLTGRVCHTAILLPDGRVLILGGHGITADLADAELYNPSEGIFVRTADLSPGRANFTVTLLVGGKVLAVGGQSNGRTLANAQLYNPTTGTWADTGSLQIARSFHTATLLENGDVLVAGGVSMASPPVFSQGAPPGSALESAELYNPASGKWTSVGNLHDARYFHTATLLKTGQVLVAGGMGSNGLNTTLSSAELYDPTTKSWTTTGSLRDSRFAHTATLLRNGHVLVVGGQLGGTPLNSAELYNPSIGRWTSTGNLHFLHSGQTATLLSTGRVLVAGGAASATTLSSCVEIYAPSNGIWKTTNSMNTAHFLHTATLLQNGNILVAGGLNPLGDPSNVQTGAELYGPATKPKRSDRQRPTVENPPSPPPAPAKYIDSFD